MKDLEHYKVDDLSFASCLIMQILLFCEPLKSMFQPIFHVHLECLQCIEKISSSMVASKLEGDKT